MYGDLYSEKLDVLITYSNQLTVIKIKPMFSISY